MKVQDLIDNFAEKMIVIADGDPIEELDSLTVTPGLLNEQTFKFLRTFKQEIKEVIRQKVAS